MDFHYRVKLLGYTTDQLLNMGFGVNTYDCEPGELWAIACSGSHMDRLIRRHKLSIIGKPEAIRG